MKERIPRIFVVLLTALLFASAPAAAQEAALGGTISDVTGGVLPGVTVTAVHTATGNVFVAVTDTRGVYRLPLRTGAFRVTAELPGFGAVSQNVELLVGQEATLNFKMAPSTLQESVTVTGQAPLIDTTSSTVGGNIDPRQMQELPINGRSWQDLALLAPGSRVNAIQDAPVERTAGGSYQINVDGQQVTQLIVQTGAFGNPKYSRDAIAEFELISNRFDASQGRSTGVQVNAITKAGTNDFAGTFSGYFRDDRFNAADHVVNRVLPYSDQQLSGTYGGPIRRNRVHFFTNLEYEREPQTVTFNTPYPRFNREASQSRREYTGGGRVDAQFTPRTRLSVRANTWGNYFPFGTGGAVTTGSATNTLASSIVTDRWMNQALGTLTQVLGDSAVNELQVGYAAYNWTLESPVHITYPAGLVLPADAPKDRGAPRVLLRGGLIIGPGHQFTPQAFNQRTVSVRDNFTYSFTARGRHNLKVGGEYLHYPTKMYFCNNCFGQLDANVAAIPSNIEALFPDLLDADTWNLGALSPIALRWRQGFGNFVLETPRYVSAGWVQDDWSPTSRLTLNLGVRYDLQLNVFGNESEILPHVRGDRPNDWNNIAPRFGAVYSLTDRMVLRGGAGKFFGELNNTLQHYSVLSSQVIQAEVQNDGRADFASNPFNGPTPTFAQLRSNLCTAAAPMAPGCIRNSLPDGLPSPDMEIPYSYQASVGMQRQIGSTVSASADYVYTAGRKELVNRNVNLAYNPATRTNYPFSDILRRPFPEWGVVSLSFNSGYSNAHALETTVTKRFADSWQLSANYTLAGLWDGRPPVIPGVDLVEDLSAEYGLAALDQRHRAVVNGIWEIGRGFQLSGLYFFGSGQRFATSWGPDLRDLGGINFGTNRLRPNGSIVPRNNFVGEPIHRVDMRLTQRITVSRVRLEGILEVFNAFNRANFGAYTTQESNAARYGLPNLNPNVAYQPRTLQLGFRVAF